MITREYQDLKKATEFIQELKDRGLIASHTDENTLISLLASGKRTYMGIDPTADFLHLGHYVGLSILKRFTKKGYPVVLILGSLTAKVGDPAFRSSSRKFNPNISHNADRIRARIERFFEKEIRISKEHPDQVPLFELIDNYQFHNERYLNDGIIQENPINVLISFMDDVCSKIKVSKLINRDFLSSRMGNGLTISEFLYSGLQGWDFLYLYKEKQVAIQIGGSDQWGNMLVGMELIYKDSFNDQEINNGENEVFLKAGAITFPIMTDAYGNKFGKSEGNAISIDDSEIEKNSYLIRQYFLNVTDSVVFDYFLKFTDLERNEIEEEISKGYQGAKCKLSACICKDIFGGEKISGITVLASDVFNGLNFENTYQEIMKHRNFFPFKSLTWKDHLYLSSIFESLELVSSKSEFNRLAKSKGVYVMGATQIEIERNDYRIKEEYVVWKDESKKEGAVIIRKGKKQYGLVHFTRIQETFDDVEIKSIENKE